MAIWRRTCQDKCIRACQTKTACRRTIILVLRRVPDSIDPGKYSIISGWPEKHKCLSVRYPQNAFYVTETGTTRNKTVYFRLDDWAEICKPVLRSLRHDNLKKLSQVSLPFAQTRNMSLLIHRIPTLCLSGTSKRAEASPSGVYRSSSGAESKGPPTYCQSW